MLKGLVSKIYLGILGAISVLGGILVWRANSLKAEAQEKQKEAEEELHGYESAHTQEFLKAEAEKTKTEMEIIEKVQEETNKLNTVIIDDIDNLKDILDEPGKHEIKL